jgi:hypothetical protein
MGFFKRPRSPEPHSRKPARARLSVVALEDRAVPAFLAPLIASGSALNLNVADFNNDGIPDLFAGTSAVLVQLGNGDGTFQAALISSAGVPSGYSISDVGIGDFNEDGLLDVVTANSNRTISLLLGTGAGTFQAPQAIPFPGQVGIAPRHLASVAVGDVNSDGKLDFVATAYAASPASSQWNPKYDHYNHVYLGQGNGSFQAQAPVLAHSNTTFGISRIVALTDFNGDGDVDQLTAYPPRIIGPGAAYLQITGNSSVFLQHGNGGGTFGAPNLIAAVAGPTAAYYTPAASVADFNGDGLLDIAAPLHADSVSIFLGCGDGTFQAPQPVVVGEAPYLTAAQDINRDGLIDLVTSSGVVLLGAGSGAFQPPQHHFAGGFPIATSDFNGDGWLDVAVGDPGGKAVLLNDAHWPADIPPLSVGDATVTEGNSGATTAAFTVTLSHASSEPVLVDFATASGTAHAGSDFVAVSGTLTFAPGETSQTINVAVHGDTLIEWNENFTVLLSNARGAAITDPQATGTIVSDETGPGELRITDVTVIEGDAGTAEAVFTVTLSAPLGQTVTVDYATADGTALAVTHDYLPVSATLSFAPGETSKTVSVTILDDSLFEPDETFSVQLSNPRPIGALIVLADDIGIGTIVNNDVAPPPSISISDISRREGRSGTTYFTFTVALSAPSTVPVTVNYATADGTAKASDNDYLPISGTLTFAPGETSKTVTIQVKGDRKREANETFFLNLSGVVNALLEDDQGIGTIENDD